MPDHLPSASFYLKRTNYSEIFEDHQGALETATEELSGLLEQNIDVDTIHKIRAEITNKTNFLKSRASTMLEDTLQGHLEVRRSASGVIYLQN